MAKRSRSSEGPEMNSSSPGKRLKPNYSETMVVMVGLEAKSFTVHTTIICRDSLFFQAACGREWKEGQEKVVHLPEVEAQLFDVYVHWAYTRELDTTRMLDPKIENAKTSGPKTSTIPPSYLNLSKI
ncbi:hypothetical protein LTR37_010445 [Vermiconidia calcicola]|uniref:Uncharacterized protein n=1 Tax=Vermiconidia calcicola TaxID=1690605 RepID=A0ACC3N554_9PEZI|nr:hypothetical protein LTR37_010445 [Vermiconidia calcicola]